MLLKRLLPVLGLSLVSLSATATEYDYDGDGKADIAVRRISNSTQYILNSSGDNTGSARGDGVQRHILGERSTDIPVTGDFDGDGIWDIGVRRPSTYEWIIRHSSTGEIVTTVLGKNEDDIPVPADYDGDGITDLAVRRPSTFTWYILNSSGVDDRTSHSDGVSRVVFGKRATDIPVPADYDGDGRADIAVRRASTYTWYIQNSSGSNFNSDRADGVQRVVFGKNEFDIPVPADYTGDGYADIAVRRPSNYTWYIKNSDGSNFNSDRADGVQRIRFGTRELDIPVPADYDGDGIADVAVRRASTQYFYVKNSDDTNFNSDRQDGIQRINFGKNENDIPVVASFNEVDKKMDFVLYGLHSELAFASDMKSAKFSFIFELSAAQIANAGREAYVNGVILSNQFAPVIDKSPVNITDSATFEVNTTDINGDFVTLTNNSSSSQMHLSLSGAENCSDNSYVYNVASTRMQDPNGNVVNFDGFLVENSIVNTFTASVRDDVNISGEYFLIASVEGVRVMKEDGTFVVFCKK